jgi:hypothetical protein
MSLPVNNKYVQDYLVGMVLSGSILFLGHLWTCFTVGEANILTLLLNPSLTGLPLTPITLIGASAMSITLFGVLSEAVRPYFKKYVNLTPEKENLFTELNPEAKALLVQEGLFPLFEKLAQGEVTPSFRAKLNFRLYYLARRWADYLAIGYDLRLTDFLADLYAKLYVCTSLLTVFATTHFLTHAIPMLATQGQADSLWLAGISSLVFGFLAIVFGTRCRMSVFQTFFHAQNLINDLPFILKARNLDQLWSSEKSHSLFERLSSSTIGSGVHAASTEPIDAPPRIEL